MGSRMRAISSAARAAAPFRSWPVRPRRRHPRASAPRPRPARCGGGDRSGSARDAGRRTPRHCRHRCAAGRPALPPASSLYPLLPGNEPRSWRCAPPPPGAMAVGNACGSSPSARPGWPRDSCPGGAWSPPGWPVRRCVGPLGWTTLASRSRRGPSWRLPAVGSVEVAEGLWPSRRDESRRPRPRAGHSGGARAARRRSRRCPARRCRAPAGRPNCRSAGRLARGSTGAGCRHRSTP